MCLPPEPRGPSKLHSCPTGLEGRGGRPSQSPACISRQRRQMCAWSPEAEASNTAESRDRPFCQDVLKSVRGLVKTPLGLGGWRHGARATREWLQSPPPTADLQPGVQRGEPSAQGWTHSPSQEPLGRAWVFFPSLFRGRSGPRPSLGWLPTKWGDGTFQQKADMSLLRNPHSPSY